MTNPSQPSSAQVPFFMLCHPLFSLPVPHSHDPLHLELYAKPTSSSCFTGDKRTNAYGDFRLESYVGFKHRLVQTLLDKDSLLVWLQHGKWMWFRIRFEACLSCTKPTFVYGGVRQDMYVAPDQARRDLCKR